MKNIFCAVLLLLAGGGVQLAEAQGCQPGCALTVEHAGASTVMAGTFFEANVVVENYISTQPNVGVNLRIDYPQDIFDPTALIRDGVLIRTSRKIANGVVKIEPGDNAPPNTRLFVGSAITNGLEFYITVPSTNLTAAGVFRIPLKFTSVDGSITGIYSLSTLEITGLEIVPITTNGIADDRNSVHSQSNTVEFRVVQSGANLEADSTAAGEGQTVDAFTLILADAPAATATVTYAVTGTAVLGTDYTAFFNIPAGGSGVASTPSLMAGIGRTLQIPADNFTAGVISIPVSIDIVRDDFRDPDETIFFTVTSVDFDGGRPRRAFANTPPSATLRIIEGVSVRVRAFLEDLITTVGEEATTDAFTLRLTNELDPSTATVTYEVAGTADLGTDYIALFNIPAGSGAASMPSLTAGTGQTLQIPAANFTNGAISIPVQITVAGYDLSDPDETILFTITRVDFGSGHAATFGSAIDSATLRIIEGVFLNVRAFLEDLIMTVGEGATTDAFTLRLTNELAPSAATVTYEVTGTATLGTDYTALFNIPAGSGAASMPSLAAGTSQTLQIPAANFTAGAISIPVQIAVARDAAEDPDETIFFTINSVDFDSGHAVTFGSTTNSVTLQITDAPLREGISVRVRVFLDGPLR